MLNDFFGATAPYDNVGGRINRGLGQRLMSVGRVQYAALPYQRTAEGLQILLITSRETRRWIVPKGWPMKNKAPCEAAEIEALQEAGIRGRIAAISIGGFDYDKRITPQEARACRVEVFPLLVTKQKAHWREERQRTRRWFGREEAAGHVEEPELKQLIATFDPE